MAAERGREAREEEKKSEERWIGAGVVGVHVRRGDKLLGIDGLHANYIQLDRFQVSFLCGRCLLRPFPG